MLDTSVSVVNSTALGICGAAWIAGTTTFGCGFSSFFISTGFSCIFTTGFSFLDSSFCFITSVFTSADSEFAIAIFEDISYSLLSSCDNF